MANAVQFQCLFGDMVGKFGAGLGAGDPHADRYTDLPGDGGAHGGRQCRLLIVVDASKVQKALAPIAADIAKEFLLESRAHVDAVHLLSRRKAFQDTHHARAHVGIEGVIAG